MKTIRSVAGVRFLIVFLLLSLSAIESRAVVPQPIPNPEIGSLAVGSANVTFIIHNTGPGRAYALEVTTNLLSGSWIYVGGFTNNTVNPNVTFIVSSNYLSLKARQTFIRLLDMTGMSYVSGNWFAGGDALIPAGSFAMGDSLDGEADANPTTISISGFFAQTNLVTYGQWQTVYNWAVTNGYTFDNAGSGKGPSYPVMGINWFDAVKWCNASAAKASRFIAPVYYTDATLTNVYTNGDIVPFVRWQASVSSVNYPLGGFRLPTEAEWEMAARGGLSGQRFPWGNTISESQANYDGNTEQYVYDLGPDGFNSNYDTGAVPYTSPVGSFPANGYGLNDMAGNVQEWCWDWYGTPYGQPTASNPTGPVSGTYRVLRGGGWSDDASHARCANRAYAPPTTASDDIGFRYVQY